MFIAMNQFLVKTGFEEAFEEIWRSRDSKLLEFDGFVSFDLLKGPEDEDGYILYASHAIWKDQDSFKAWTKSDQFKASHQRPKPKVDYKGPPRFVGFETLDGLSIVAD